MTKMNWDRVRRENLGRRSPSRAVTFKALFPGHCPRCGKPIKVGQRIKRSDGDYVHARCQPKDRIMPLAD
jgi:hypothetical protein